MVLFYGTGNRAKIDHMNEMLTGLDISCRGIGDVVTDLPRVVEEGASPLENARLKALTYGALTPEPVFSCDSGLYLEGVAPADQPGLYVRRVGGRELSDEEMIAHYAGLAQRYGGQLTARYSNAVCLVQNGRILAESQADDLASVDFLLVAEPSKTRRPGFPLDSLSVNPLTGGYYIDTPSARRDDTNKVTGFRRFFSEFREKSLPME